MKPATHSKRFFGATRLLVLSDGPPLHSTVDHLADHFSPGDVFVVNRSATLPSSFRGRLEGTGEAVEIRLASFQGPNVHTLENWLAFSFGAGDWRAPTELRGAPPALRAGDILVFGVDLKAEVRAVRHDRLIDLRFRSSNLERELYRHGRPIQYSYLTSDLKIWDQQTLFSGPPISVEPPSAAFPLTWDLIFQLKARGVRVVSLLQGAGISSTGSKFLDGLLPLKEWFEVPPETAEAITLARNSEKKIIAAGTTVLRALESSLLNGKLISATGLTGLKITPDLKIRTATGLLTGMHELGTSHMEILKSFCGSDVIAAGYEEAIALGYRSHEYGDVSLLDCGCGAA